jgi:hypothetical protein
VVGEVRVLDLLKDRAMEALELAGPDDRVWVLRAGEPWSVAPPTDPAGARARIRDTEVSGAASELDRSLRRARELVGSSPLPAAEIHLLSDLQASSLSGDPPPSPRDARPETPVVAWAPSWNPEPSRWLAGVEVAEGLAPLEGERVRIAVDVGGRGVESPLPVRVVVDGDVVAAGSARPGETVVLSAGPFPRGPVTGWVETDPDALGGDDRIPFAFRVGPAVAVARTGPPSFFLDRALETLEAAGRVRLADPEAARVLVAVEGVGLDVGDPRPVVVVPPADPDRRPALNLRLEEAGIPWRLDPPRGAGGSELTGSVGGVELEGIRVARSYDLVPSRGPGIGSTGEPGPGVRATTAAGDAAMVDGPHVGEPGTSRPWMLLAVPLDPEWSDLPVAAAMVPFVGWAVGRAGPSGAGNPGIAGEPLPLPPGATAVETPGGTTIPVDGTPALERTGTPGVYRIRRGDSIVDRVAVRPPPAESTPERLAPAELDAVVGSALVTVDDARRWPSRVFRERRGPEPWRPLLIVVLILVTVEGWFATSRSGRSRDSAPSPAADDPPSPSSSPRGADPVGASIP